MHAKRDGNPILWTTQTSQDVYIQGTSITNSNFKHHIYTCCPLTFQTSDFIISSPNHVVELLKSSPSLLPLQDFSFTISNTKSSPSDKHGSFDNTLINTELYRNDFYKNILHMLQYRIYSMSQQIRNIKICFLWSPKRLKRFSSSQVLNMQLNTSQLTPEVDSLLLS